MDKQNLYYIVFRDTNARLQFNGSIFIATKEAALKKCDNIGKHQVIISIANYENKFTETKKPTHSNTESVICDLCDEGPCLQTTANSNILDNELCIIKGTNEADFRRMME